MSLSRSEFEKFVAEADLGDKDVRQQINGTVINEVISTRYKHQAWEVAGFAPLDTSQQQYLRPVAKVVYGLDGWYVLILNEWFCD